LGSRYKELGIDVKKQGVDRFKGYIDNLFPAAFCVVYRDPCDESMGLVLHTDSAGSKPIQAYLMYRETGDASEHYPTALLTVRRFSHGRDHPSPS
jgi:phosphoribosylformylglycinamidine cyclo-ligase